MNETIQKALLALENADVAGYFEEMDKVEMPQNLKPIYAAHKSKFMQGLQTHDFYQQLAVFARAVENPEEAVRLSTEANSGKTIIQNAEKIYNIDKIDKADFN